MIRRKSYRTTTPFDGGLSPLTDKSRYAPVFGGTPLIQDIINGTPTQPTDIHGRGNWSDGPDVSNHYRETPDDYMRTEQERARQRERAVSRMRGSRKDEWVVELEDGTELVFPTHEVAVSELAQSKVPYRRLKKRFASASSSTIVDQALKSCVEIVVNMGGKSDIGAGFCVAPGIFMTCSHVVGGKHPSNPAIRISTADDSEGAEILFSDPVLDIAVIKSPLNLEPMQFGMTSNYDIGDAVFAVGSPRGVGNVVSDGIISAKARKVLEDPHAPLFMFTDALVAPGSSGGPLIAYSSGRVVGMMSIIFGAEEGLPGFNGAIPSEYLVKILKEVGGIRQK